MVAKKQSQTVSLATLSLAQKANMLNELSLKDRKLKALMAKVEGGFALTIKEAHSPFEAISEAIIYQQLTGKAAATILGRFKALFGSAPFPKPQQIVDAPDTVLRSAGLSRAKVVALKDLADKTLSGKIPTLEEVDKMTDEEIVKCLTSVKGVGTWTAHMFLMFRLGRPDVMPSGDYGVRKGFAITYGDGATLPSPAELEKHAESWRPYRSVGSWFMWRAIEVNRLFSVPENKTVKKKRVAKKPEFIKSVSKTTATKSTGTTKSARKKPTAKSTVAKEPAAKKPTRKSTIANKPAAKKPTRKSTAAKKPALRKRVSS